MGHRRGRSIPLSPPRKLIGDLMAASRGMPLIPFERTMDLGEVASARLALPVRPTWYSLFIRAYAQVATHYPELRRTYVSYPWPRLYEHAISIASFAVERRWNDEDAVLFDQIREPETRPLWEIDAEIRRAKEAPLDERGSFRRLRRLMRLPTLLRRMAWGLLNWSGPLRVRQVGTFAISATTGLGASALTLVSPATTTLCYGPMQADGRMAVRVIFDHRVLDGGTIARAMVELEDVLTHDITAELRRFAAAA